MLVILVDSLLGGAASRVDRWAARRRRQPGHALHDSFGMSSASHVARGHRRTCMPADMHACIHASTRTPHVCMRPASRCNALWNGPGSDTGRDFGAQHKRCCLPPPARKCMSLSCPAAVLRVLA